MDSSPKRPHILVMEDESVIRTLIVKSMQRKGYEVSEAADGCAAIEAFAALPEAVRVNCLLILDLIVPTGMGGKEALAEIRKTDPEVKAIIASGLADDKEMDALIEPGKTGILTKPYHIGDLDAAIQQMADHNPDRD